MPVNKTPQASGVSAQATPKGASELFNEAVAKKRGGDLDGALQILDEALRAEPGHVPSQMARAGYVALNGDVDKGRELLSQVQTPPDTVRGRFNAGVIDFHVNQAWFAALVGDDDAVAGHLKSAIPTEYGDQLEKAARDYVADFVATEPDLARLRDTAAVQAAIAAPTARAEQATPTRDVADAGNPTERAAASDFASQADAPRTGSSVLATRVAAMTTEDRPDPAQVALSPLAKTLPNAQATAGRLRGEVLAEQVTASLASQIRAGDDRARIDTDGDMGALLEWAFGDKDAGAEALVAALEDLGYDADHSAFAGMISIGVPAPAVDKTKLLDELRALTPPGRGAAVAQLETLIEDKIAAAHAKGETRASLETGELDHAIRRMGAKQGAYGALADVLESLGYRAFADGFVGVSFSWEDVDTRAPDADRAAKDLAANLPAPDTLAARAGSLADVIKSKMSEAAADRRQRADLETEELDALLDGSGVSYDDVASALEEAGFRAFADGWGGVSFDWEDAS